MILTSERDILSRRKDASDNEQAHSIHRNKAKFLSNEIKDVHVQWDESNLTVNIDGLILGHQNCMPCTNRKQMNIHSNAILKNAWLHGT